MEKMAMQGAFCRDPEGWGPLSPTRSDFTPCFVDAAIDVANIGLLISGSAWLHMLLRRKPYPISLDWSYWAKLTLIVTLLVPYFLLASIQYEESPAWELDIRFWTPILSCFSFVLAFSIHHYEHARSKVASGVLLIYWLMFIIIHGIQIRQAISLQEQVHNRVRFVALCIVEAIAVLIFAFEWLVPKKASNYSAVGDDDEFEVPTDRATVFSILTFDWMTPLMKRGYSKFLTEHDMWDLRAKDSANVTENKFTIAWSAQLEKKKPSLWIAMGKAFGAPYALGAVFKAVQDMLAFVQPQLLRILIAFVASYKTDTPQPAIKGLSIAALMFLTSVVQTISLHQYFQHSFETGMRVKTSLTAAIYRKSIKLSNEGREAKSTGDIVNLQAVDTQRLQDLTQFLNQLWSAPFQITLCMVSLYQLLGPSSFAGVGAMLIMIPINGVIASIMKSLQKRQMKNKDSRTRLMTEILNNMKAIKLYGWAVPFKQKLDHVRNDQELHTLKKIGVTQAFANFLWGSTSFIVSCTTFAVFVLTNDKPLSTDIVFPALALFNLLTFPLTMLPMIMTSLVEASVAVGRITSFLTADELQEDAVRREDPVLRTGDETVRIANASFSWNKNDPESKVLRNINFSANKGELSCIIGKVGSGKSSVLQAIIGELWKSEGDVIVRGTVAYHSQQYFIMNASIRENILFGHRYDPEFYQKTIRACALLEDLASLTDGDETQVGEKGISLSGGQKARVTLARAVYARADVYLLDDPLSAVDQHVGKHLIEQVLGPQGLLAGKTRIMATNSIPILREAARVTLIVQGEFTESGSYQSVMQARGPIFNIVRHLKDKTEEEDDKSSDSDTIVGVGAGASNSEEDDVPELAGRTLGVKKRRESRISLRRASAVSLTKSRRKIADEEESGAMARSGQTKEFSEQGKVKWGVYTEYAKACNYTGVMFYAVALIAAQIAQVGGSLWLKRWSEVNSEHGGNPETGKYIGIYLALGVSASALAVVQTLVLWMFCSIQAAKKLHEAMANCIFRVKMQFIETTPAGRILNRFSNDIYRIDEVIARCFNMLFQNCAKSLATLTIISVTTPPFIAVAIPLAFLYGYIQRYYLRTSRELKRLESVSRSPIYAHFQETLGGISTIRAYRQQNRFVRENEFRIDENIRSYFPSVSANRWLAVRLEFIGSFVILGSAGFAVLSVASGSSLSAGAVGLAMSYALNITQSLNWIVRQTVEVETNIVSVERVLEYSRLESEAADIIPESRPPTAWPAAGAITFNNFSTRYREGLDLVLKNINLHISPHEKIGIVGRTGAGKSSLTLSLFRIIEAAEGHIEIDGIRTDALGLQDLRQRLSIIPQDPSIFEGTIRHNLDPRNAHDDTDLWNALALAHMKEKIASMPLGLDSLVHEGGSNLSVGEKALISLSRALLTPSNIMVMDEATGSLDTVTDSMIQEVIRSIQSTVLIIAHRIDTVLFCDRIVVLDKGEVVETGSPAALLNDPESRFWKMCESTGEIESYVKAATEWEEKRQTVKALRNTQ